MALSLELAEKIFLSGFRPSIVVAILRGGYIVAKLVSDYLGIDEIATTEIKFYRGIGEKGEKPIISTPLIRSIKDEKVLIVDDVADSGRTLQVAIDLVRIYGAKEVKTATLYLKPWSITVPDYYVAETRSWIVFPWEVSEILRELAKKLGGFEKAISILNLEKYYNKEIIERIVKIAKHKA
ncbi:phosphoribosyltransferase [Ignisphaera sp. 4213-co]|uniref:Phosphoribosyltransferase n=1 Tax=Ignisphaera cupida TaxID=3050454 RepID=A0ABD4Z5U1_9CREN|nr:phosphoribosyltransferase [Ignisphaera sp. 4213-co]MDK6028574.1 phosphoribosyltransferase [Ignisphaera sp. 4213-co]